MWHDDRIREISDLTERLTESMVMHLYSGPVEKLHGALFCPACQRVHGRSIELLYPLLWLYKKKKTPKLFHSFKKLLQWSRCLKRKDGSYENDLHIVSWNGITVFNGITYAKILTDFKDILPQDIVFTMEEDLCGMVEYVYETFTIETGNINYPAAATYLLELAAHYFCKQHYSEKAKSLANQLLSFFTEEYILFGEGYPQRSKSDNQARPIDIAYNLCESLPYLYRYGLLAKNNRIIEQVIYSYYAHRIFLLPNGGIDNSWCCRNYKWTFWGSRTCNSVLYSIFPLTFLSKEFHVFVKNHIQLLNSSLSSEGLLYGGMSYGAVGEEACIHHSFCVAKSLAMLLVEHDSMVPYYTDVSDTLEELPIHSWSTLEGTASFFVNRDKWRATISDYDWIYRNNTVNNGGVITLLYHESWGTIIAAGLKENVMPEVFNMQAHISKPFISPSSTISTNTMEGSAKMHFTAEDRRLVVCYSTEKKDLHTMDLEYSLDSNNCFNIIAMGREYLHSIRLPIVIHNVDSINYSDNGIVYTKGKMTLTISLKNCMYEVKGKGFAYQPGFEFLDMVCTPKDKGKRIYISFFISNDEIN